MPTSPHTVGVLSPKKSQERNLHTLPCLQKSIPSQLLVPGDDQGGFGQCQRRGPPQAKLAITGSVWSSLSANLKSERRITALHR